MYLEHLYEETKKSERPLFLKAMNIIGLLFQTKEVQLLKLLTSLWKQFYLKAMSQPVLRVGSVMPHQCRGKSTSSDLWVKTHWKLTGEAVCVERTFTTEESGPTSTEEHNLFYASLWSDIVRETKVTIKCPTSRAFPTNWTPEHLEMRSK